MSGGSLNYGSSKIDDIVYEMGIRSLTPKMRAFREFLVLVSNAVHDVEWELSGDYGPGDSDEAIDAVMPKVLALQVAIKDADEALERLRSTIEEAKKK